MKLYTTPGALNPIRVALFLAEKGMDIEREVVNLMKLEHKKPEFAAISLNGRVPVLELDDGSRICESIAICRYLESLAPEPNLFGQTPREVADIEMWDRIIESQVMLPFAHVFRHTHPAMAVLEDQVPEFGLRQKGVGQARLTLLNQQMQDRDFVVGSRFTNADISLYCTLRFFRRSGAELNDTHPALQTWWQRIHGRPAIGVTFQ